MQSEKTTVVTGRRGEHLCAEILRKLFGFWDLLLSSSFFSGSEVISVLFWKLDEVFCSFWNAGYQRVRVRTPMMHPCWMHVQTHPKQQRPASADASIQLSLVLFYFIFECKSLSGNSTANNKCKSIDYRSSPHPAWPTMNYDRSQDCQTLNSAALMSWHLVSCFRAKYKPKVCPLPTSESRKCNMHRKQ